jgi:hypothetical protein
MIGSAPSDAQRGLDLVHDAFAAVVLDVVDDDRPELLRRVEIDAELGK